MEKNTYTYKGKEVKLTESEAGAKLDAVNKKNGTSFTLE